MRRREMAGCGHPLPFAAAAGLALGLALFAHQLLLTLAAVVIGPLPAVQTALYLSRKDLSENAAQAVSEPAQETQAEPAQEAPALPAGDIETYLVPLEGDEARPEGAGAILEKNYPQGSGEKYIPCGSGSIKNNTSVSSADIAAEITNPLPFAVEWNSPDPQILIMHTHATEDYRLSAGLWYRPGDGSRTTDRDLNMCAVGRVMADTLNAAGHIHTGLFNGGIFLPQYDAGVVVHHKILVYLLAVELLDVLRRLPQGLEKIGVHARKGFVNLGLRHL